MDQTVTPFVKNEELGIETTNFWINASTFLYIFGIMVVYWFALRMIGMQKPAYKEKADKAHVRIFFNTLIKWHAINFLELVMAFLFSSTSKSGF